MQEKLTTRLRPVVPADYDVLDAIRRDVELQKLLLGARDPIDEAVTSWLERRKSDGWIRAVVDSGDKCLGYVQLSEFHRNNRVAWFGICLAGSARGHGHGAAATRLVLRTAGNDLNLRKVSLRVRADNPAGRLYQRLGFRVVGTQVEEYDAGEALFDVIIMEHLCRETGDM